MSIPTFVIEEQSRAQKKKKRCKIYSCNGYDFLIKKINKLDSKHKSPTYH